MREDWCGGGRVDGGGGGDVNDDHVFELDVRM